MSVILHCGYVHKSNQIKINFELPLRDELVNDIHTSN